MRLIALTSDFGEGSPYVAQMKAVLYSAVPGVTIVDVTHSIAPQSIRDAEVVLRSTAFAFPLGTVHVVVVDPGVGTARRPIALEARGLFFVGPDNGVLAQAATQPGARAVTLDKPELFRRELSPTFHGRDLFAPVAGELAAGLSLVDVGSPCDVAILAPSTLPPPTVAARVIRGVTLSADTFGNLTSNIPTRLLGSGWRVAIDGRPTVRVRTYGEAAPGALLSLCGSDGFLEIAVRDGSAARTLGSADGLEIVCEQ